eukprot:7342242-Ditylum_brightwellii.AAC.1
MDVTVPVERSFGSRTGQLQWYGRIRLHYEGAVDQVHIGDRGDLAKQQATKYHKEAISRKNSIKMAT